MSAIREPRSTAQAVELLERYSVLAGELAVIEANRDAAIAATNAVADALATPVLADLEAMRGKLGAWWGKAGGALTEGKRKSIELGGCMVGTRMSRATLTMIGDDDAMIQALSAVRWGKPFLRTKVTIDRVATLRGLAGDARGKLVELGFGASEAVAVFFVEPVKQGGTLG